jgi:RNA binding exosome subunit
MRLERAIIRLHVKPEETESYENYKSTLFFVAGEDMSEIMRKKGLAPEQIKDIKSSKIDFHESTAVGFEERKIVVMELLLKNPKKSEEMLKRIFEALSDDDRRLLYMTADSRIDDDNKLYIRLDKEALKEGKHILTDSGDCYRIAFHITTYPKDREQAIKDFLEFIPI